VDRASGFHLQILGRRRVKGTDCLARKELLVSARLGRRSLARLRDELSERDRQLIHTVASHRFLSGKQLHRFHFADHATPETGARVARAALARLTGHGVLVRLQRRVGGVRAGSASYVYALGPVGRRLAGEQTGRQVREPSTTFLEHTLAIAETHLTLLEASRRGRLELIAVEVEPTCWRRYLNTGGASETLRPDLYALTARGEFEYCWFLEVDRGTEYRPALLRKCRAYESYWRTGAEQQRSGTFPRVVWIAPDEERAQAIEQAIGSAPGLKRELFRTTTNERLVELLAGGEE
jgi:hypothetical protein